MSNDFLAHLMSGVIKMMTKRGFEFEDDTWREFFSDGVTAELLENFPEELTAIQHTIFTHPKQKGASLSNRKRLSSIFTNPESKESCGVVFVEFSQTKSIPIDEILIAAQVLIAHKLDCLIIIGEVKLSPCAMDEIKNTRSALNFIQIFLDEELLYDPTSSIYGPDIIILSDEERKDIIEKEGIIPREYPKIRMYDPSIKYLGVREGSIIKFVRKAVIPGTPLKTSIYFRYLIDVQEKPKH